jgi:hypothetical protein
VQPAPPLGGVDVAVRVAVRVGVRVGVMVTTVGVSGVVVVPTVCVRCTVLEAEASPVADGVVSVAVA